MSKVSMPRAVYEQVRAHGEEAYPEEGCGALLGLPEADGWSVSSAVRTGNNSSDAQRRYSIAPLELVKIEREAKRQGLEIAGFYHSHPDHAAEWSPADFAEAHWIGCCYVITAVERGAAATTNSFLLAGTREEDKQFIAQLIELRD